jgi:hypothetical protein
LITALRFLEGIRDSFYLTYCQHPFLRQLLVKKVVQHVCKQEKTERVRTGVRI